MPRTRALPLICAVSAVATALIALSGCTVGSASPESHATPAAGASTSGTAPTASSAAECAGVFVTVQYGLLGRDDVNACAAATAPITAQAALKSLGVTTEGTEKYKAQVVCRVNGLPSASTPISVPGKAPYTEKCQDMPAAFAYWAMWVRDSAAGKWGYASSGVATQQLKPGQTLGLKFTTGTDTTPPQG
jgi:hypothetical protein